MDKITAVTEYLDRLGAEYEIFFHESAPTIEHAEKIERTINGKICKNLLLVTSSGKDIFLLMMSGEKRFVTKEVSKKIGSSRLSFASGETMISLLNTSPGSLSVMSLIFDKEKRVLLVADKDVFGEEYICCHPCDNTATLKIKTEEMLNKIIPALGRNILFIEI